MTSSRAARTAEFGFAPIRRNYPGCQGKPSTLPPGAEARAIEVHLAARVKLVPFPWQIPAVSNPKLPITMSNPT